MGLGLDHPTHVRERNKTVSSGKDETKKTRSNKRIAIKSPYSNENINLTKSLYKCTHAVTL